MIGFINELEKQAGIANIGKSIASGAKKASGFIKRNANAAIGVGGAATGLGGVGTFIHGGMTHNLNR